MNAVLESDFSKPLGMQSKQTGSGIVSLIVPTRNRPDNILRFSQSLRQNTDRPQQVELVLVIDDDDRSYDAISFDGLWVTKVTTPAGSAMGELNRAGYDACSGDYIMLLNDDVLIETPGWDTIVSAVFQAHPDDVILVHVNDKIFNDKLCTFPFLTRLFCELAGGICPADYRRYRIDDHIYNVFNLLSVLGRNRIVYLPDVEFRHLNFVTDEHGQNEYQPDPAIHEADTNLFIAALPERKALAVKLAEVIDQYRWQQVQEVRGKVLEPILDSVSLRRPEFVRSMSMHSKLTSEQERVTIGVVSADTHSKHAQACLEAIKSHTTNYDLVVLDNNRGPNFNHPREMNAIISACRNNYLVLMDDDVIVEPGWLNGLLSGMAPHVGVVTPLHKSTDGKLSYAGVVMRPDHSGHHTHAFALYPHAFPIQTLCSAIVLVDMNKCGHVRFDESYSKYFLDLDYGLRIWEKGFQVVCSPDVCVTHIGGATLDWASEKASRLFEEQRQHFVEKWIATERYQAIELGQPWQNAPEISTILGLPGKLSSLLQQIPEPDLNGALDVANDFFRQLDHFPAVKNWVSDRIRAELNDRKPDFSRPENRRFAALAGQIGTLQPVLVEEGYRGFNLVQFDRFYGLTSSTGAFDAAHAERGGYPLHGETVESVKTQIDALQPTLVEEGYKGFNLVRFDRIYGLAQRDGPFDATRAAQGAYPFCGWSVEAVKAQIDALQPFLLKEGYKGFNLIQFDRIYGLAQRDGPFDATRAAQGGYPLHGETTESVEAQIKRTSEAQIKRASSRLRSVLARVRSVADVRRRRESSNLLSDSRRWVALDPTRKIVEDYKGFAIHRLEYKFFAIPVLEGPFSYEAYRRKEYSDCLIGHGVEEVKQLIDRHGDLNSASLDRLVFASLADDKMKRLLSTTADSTKDWLLVGRDQELGIEHQRKIVVDYPTVIEWAADVASGKSADLSMSIGQKRFGAVVVPWAYPDTWRNNSLELAASLIANHVEIVTEDAAKRSYHGETVHRLLYNKAYLSSMLEVVPLRGSLNVLEVGCSDGLVCDILSLLGARKVTGVDVMTTAGCSFQGTNGEFLSMDATDLQFEDQSFDIVYSIATLEHVPDPYKAIDEMIRTLRIGGYCYVQAAPLYYSPFGHHMFSYFADYPWAHLRLTKEEIVAYLKQKGMDDHLLRNLAVTPETYVEEMLNPDHLNGLTLEKYRLDELRSRADIEVLKFNPSLEGKHLLSPSILGEIKKLNPALGEHSLVEHGFELAFRRKS